jgi:hypothetical protein
LFVWKPNIMGDGVFPRRPSREIIKPDD